MKHRKLTFHISYIWMLLMLLSSCNSVATSAGSANYKNTTVSYYANKFNGKKTASGETYHHSKMTAASKNFAFGTKIEIVNPKNNQKVIVTINDRGPLKPSRMFDLSQGAFKKIASLKDGMVSVKYRVLN